MKKNKEQKTHANWLINDVSLEARDIAKRNAKIEGVRIGKWVDSVIINHDKKLDHPDFESEFVKKIDNYYKALDNMEQSIKKTIISQIEREFEKKAWWRFW